MGEQHINLAALFRQLLPAESILASEEERRPYECDGLSVYRRLPLLVVLPETVEQVQKIMRLCSEHEVPVVARGAGTGLSGGALPIENGVLLSLAKFNRILNVDPDNRTARVQPGVRNLAISEAVDDIGLYYAPDPSSQIACTIGGNVAENAGGVHCLKYGLTVHNIKKLTVVTIDGDLLEIGSEAMDAPGYDLLALMTGSEGLLSIIVEVTVRLLPKPERAQVMLAAFDDVAEAGAAVSGIISAGIIPAGLEMMDKLAIEAAEDFVHAGYPRDAEAILLCELDGTNEEVSEQIHTVRGLLNQHGATEVRTAKTEAERLTFWKGRKAAFPAMGRKAPDYYCMDGTIPRHHLPEVLTGIGNLSREYNLPVANVFHAGDGNLHPLILYDANKEGELERTEEMGGKILELCIQMGGSITGEHGVGIEKINQMCVQFNSAELTQMHAVKTAFDPHSLLNPGKAVPTLHRCAEFGAMHVHDGELPFPGVGPVLSMGTIVSDIDCSKHLVEQVRKSFDEATPLCITGSGSKSCEARLVAGKPLSVLEHHGIIEHAPSELVITVRAGTSLDEIEAQLAGSSQMLAFEPPHLDMHTDGFATIGGTLSCGLSGPRRPYAGAARDFVLGARIINGRGEILKFGGQVMKNVAGYDISRLMVGAHGTLGVLLDVSLKVLPVPECESTLCLEMSAENAIQTMNLWAGKSVPLSAACYVPQEEPQQGQLWLRLSGVESAIKAAALKIGGEKINEGQQFWIDLRERKLEFFEQSDLEQAGQLWRLSLPPASAALSLPGACLIDWGGAQRWLKTQASTDEVQSAATELGGHATLYHPGGAQLQPLSPGLHDLHKRLKETFDPKNILNPGRLYEGL